MEKIRISVLSCGGTIEKTYDEGDGSLSNRESILGDLLNEHLRLPHHELDIQAIMHRDSLDMKDEDRRILLRRIQEELSKGDPVLVIHGTDTMDQSASFVDQNLSRLEVPIVFTGAMKPFGFRDSDALQNVSESIMALNLSAPGVYISFHGVLFEARHAKKNYERKTFEHI